MSEQVENNLPQETPQETQPEVKADPYVEKAMEMGWRPKEEWDGPEEDFIDAKEFVRRQPLFEKIEHQHKAIKELQKAFDAFKTHHTRVKEAEYQRALKSLKEARKEALREGETERALAYEEKIEDIEQQKTAFEQDASQVPTPQEPTAHPEFVAWKTRNRWYERDEDMRDFADTYGITLAKKGKTPSEVLELVEKQVRKTYPEKFTNPNRDKPSAVEAPTRNGTTNDGFTMSDEERSIMKKIVRAGGITEAEYIKELRRVKGL